MSALQNIPLKTITGEPASLNDYAGKVLLVVNVASKCGLTPQYEGLESLYDKYRDRGLVVLGFPANDFAGQEPGSNAEIAEFCRSQFSIEFPMFSKITVTGPDIHPLYTALTTAPAPVTGDVEAFRQKLKGFGVEPTPAPGILWNFEKFLVGRDGTVAARFTPDTTPADPALAAAIEAQLGAIKG